MPEERTKLSASTSLALRYERDRQAGDLRTVALRGVVKVRQLGMYQPRQKNGVRPQISKPGSVPMGHLTPERLEKLSVDVRDTLTPPFHKRIEAAYAKYRKQIPDHELYALEGFYELGAAAMNASHAKLTAGYNPDRVSGGDVDYQHLSQLQRREYWAFKEIWDELDPGLQSVAFDLLFEMTRPTADKPMSVIDVGAEISGYRDERRAVGAAVTALRVLAWRIIFLQKHKKRKKISTISG